MCTPITGYRPRASLRKRRTAIVPRIPPDTASEVRLGAPDIPLAPASAKGGR